MTIQFLCNLSKQNYELTSKAALASRIAEFGFFNLTKTLAESKNIGFHRNDASMRKEQSIKKQRN